MKEIIKDTETIFKSGKEFFINWDLLENTLSLTETGNSKKTEFLETYDFVGVTK